MLSWDEIWSRFVRQFTIWPKEVNMVSRTQPSGPLCLWQCLINTYQMSCHKALVWSQVSKHFITKYSQVPVLLHLSGCQLRLQHQLHLWRTLLVRKHFQRWLKVTKYPTIWSPKMAQSHQKSRHFIFSKSPKFQKSTVWSLSGGRPWPVPRSSPSSRPTLLVLNSDKRSYMTLRPGWCF